MPGSGNLLELTFQMRRRSPHSSRFFSFLQTSLVPLLRTAKRDPQGD
jgi:hypothetical protein